MAWTPASSPPHLTALLSRSAEGFSHGHFKHTFHSFRTKVTQKPPDSNAQKAGEARRVQNRSLGSWPWKVGDLEYIQYAQKCVELHAIPR